MRSNAIRAEDKDAILAHLVTVPKLYLKFRKEREARQYRL